MPDDEFRKPHLTKAFAPRREWDVAISDGPAERLGEDTRIVIQIGRFRARQIVDLSDMRCGVVEDRRDRSRVYMSAGLRAVVEALKLKEGDEIEITVADTRRFEIARDRRREEALKRLRALRRPLPPGFRFDRDEANER